jgi:outer membrane protein assembly factor BamB
MVWSQEQNIKWRTELPGEGWSSPVVVGNSVYLSAAIADDRTISNPSYDLALLVLDVRTGIIRRQVSLFSESSDAPRIHKKNSHASPTPVFSGSRLYIHFGHQGTACTTLSGDVVWKNDSLGYRPVHGNGGSPVVVDGLLIFSRDGGDVSETTALDADSGKIVWRTERNTNAIRPFSFCTPQLLELKGRKQLISPGSNVVQSLDPRTGKEYWRVAYEGYSVVPRPIYESGLVFVCTGFQSPDLLAIDPTGSGDVTDTHLTWQTSSGIPTTSSLVGFDGKIALVSDKGIATCFEARTGEVLWKERLGGNFSASPILHGNHLYLLSEEGVCTILDVSAEPTQLAVNRLGESCLASPAVVEGDLLIRTSAALYRISSR